MKFKVYHILLFFTLLFVIPVKAQVDRRIGREQYKRPAGKSEKVDFVVRMAEYYQKELKLDDFQAAAVKSALEDERDNIEGLNSERDITKNERQDKVKIIFDRIDAKILPLLNEEQKKKYKELRKISDERVELD